MRRRLTRGAPARAGLTDACHRGATHAAVLLIAYPFVPSLMTDLFASRAAGTPLRCGAFAPADAPPACTDAHASVALWFAATGLVSTAGVSLAVTPLLGALSDLHGRKPFIVLGMAATLPPLATLLAVSRGMLPLPSFFVLCALCDGISSMAPGQAYVVDVVAPERRAAAFGLVTAVFSAALLLGPLLARPMPDAQTALAVALAGSAASLAWVAAALPESLPEVRAAVRVRWHPWRPTLTHACTRAQAARAAEAVRRAAAKEAAAGGGAAARCCAEPPAALRGLRIAVRSSLFRRLTALVVLTALAGDALGDVTTQYLQLTVGFGPKEQARAALPATCATLHCTPLPASPARAP
jgi:MFS family permease